MDIFWRYSNNAYYRLMMILIIGLPNCGKSTYAKRYDNVIHFDSVPHIWIDDWFANCNQAAKDTEGDVCVEGVYNDRRNRMLLLEAVKDKPYKNICIWIDVPLEECIRREERHRPIEIIELHAKNFEPPTYDEGWDEIIVIKGEAHG